MCASVVVDSKADWGTGELLDGTEGLALTSLHSRLYLAELAWFDRLMIAETSLKEAFQQHDEDTLSPKDIDRIA